MMESKAERIQEEQRNDSVCEICHVEMELVKVKPRKWEYDKFHDYYKCPICGFINRQRTLNEILRDIGLRDKEDEISELQTEI